MLFDLVDHRYLVDIYNCTARELVLLKAGQVGASEYLVSYAMHASDVRLATGLYVFPTDTHVSDFSSARIGPAIEASPYLTGIIVEGRAAGGKRGADRVTLKRVRNRFLYLRGAKVTPDGKAPQLKAVDADVLILDEVDEMDPRAPDIALKRLGHSLIAEVRWASTPSYPGIGIHAKWQESDQREWHVRCEHCGMWQPLSIGQVVVEWDDLERPVHWHGRKDNCAYAACTKCMRRLDHLAPGQWVAMNPGSDVVGFHLTKLFSSRIDLLTVVEALKTTNETKRRECFNQDLGLPYAPKGGKLSDAELDACRRDRGFSHQPVGGEHPVMGVDVGRVLYGVIRSYDAETGVRPQRWAGDIANFDDVAYLMRRYQVRKLVIDALPETTKARELQAAFPPGVVWLAYYVNQKIGTKRAEPVQWNDDEFVVNLDRTRTLDLTMSRVFDKINDLPANARDIPGYYAQMTSSVRVIEDGPGGSKVIRYVESGPDHFMHAENYCTVASLAPSEMLDAEEIDDFGGYGG